MAPHGGCHSHPTGSGEMEQSGFLQRRPRSLISVITCRDKPSLLHLHSDGVCLHLLTARGMHCLPYAFITVIQMHVVGCVRSSRVAKCCNADCCVGVSPAPSLKELCRECEKTAGNAVQHYSIDVKKTLRLK